MNLDKKVVAWLLIAWAFFIIVASLNVPVFVPIVLMIFGTFLYLVA